MLRDLFVNKNFVLHWAGAAFFQTGNFFSLVAFPWLILSITANDPIATTMVMAAISLPHGVFVLFGGAIADRISALKLIYHSRIAFFIVMLSFSVMVYFEHVPLPLIYFYAFLTGTIGALGFPGVQALLPELVPQKSLGYANAVIMGTGQLAQICGPILAGWAIWLGRISFNVPVDGIAYRGLALAFFVDAATALVAFFLVSKVSTITLSDKASGVASLMRQGLSFCWRDRGMRLVLFYILVISFFLQGPLLASLPIFTKVSLGLSEGAYGSLYAVLGLGTIVGAALGASKISIRERLGWVVLGCNFAGGFCFLLLAKASVVWQAAILLVGFGIANGIVMIAGTTWFQVRTPAPLMGRVMGVLMFAVVGLVPISATICGYLISTFSTNGVFILCGSAAMLIAAGGFCISNIRSMGDVPALKNISIQSTALGSD